MMTSNTKPNQRADETDRHPESILSYIDSLEAGSFAGWSTDSIIGYKTALISIREFALRDIFQNPKKEDNKLPEIISLPKEESNCKSCEYSFIVGEDRQQALLCRRYPPEMRNIQRLNALTKQAEVSIISIQPEVTKDTWCGEHTERIKK